MGNKKRFGIIALVIAILGVIGILFFQGQPPDDEQIRQALRDSIQAGKEGRAGSMLDLLSDDFNLDGVPYGNATELKKRIRDSKPDITLDNWRPVVDGDDAMLATPVTVKIGIPFNTTISFPEVKMRFRKERTTRWLVFPGRRWRLRSVETGDSNAAELMP